MDFNLLWSNLFLFCLEKRPIKRKLHESLNNKLTKKIYDYSPTKVPDQRFSKATIDTNHERWLYYIFKRYLLNEDISKKYKNLTVKFGDTLSARFYTNFFPNQSVSWSLSRTINPSFV